MKHLKKLSKKELRKEIKKLNAKIEFLKEEMHEQQLIIEAANKRTPPAEINQELLNNISERADYLEKEIKDYKKYLPLIKEFEDANGKGIDTFIEALKFMQEQAIFDNGIHYIDASVKGNLYNHNYLIEMLTNAKSNVA